MRSAAGVLLAILASASAQAADPAKGRAVFQRCAICHALAPGQNRLGPTLAGVFGRRAGAVPGFVYSPAMKRSGIVWTPATLDAFVRAPRAVVPGTRMAFAGMPNDAERANLIAYLAAAGGRAR